MKITMSKAASLCGVKPEILAARPVVFSTAERLGCEWLVIHCIRDGQHANGSRHYFGLAEDYDPIGWNAAQILGLRDEIAANISEEYDIVAHSTHLHVEYDPKKNTRV